MKFQLIKYARPVIKAALQEAIRINITLPMAACSPPITQPIMDIQATLALKGAGIPAAEAPSVTNPIPSFTSFSTSTEFHSPTVSYNSLPALVNVFKINLRSGSCTQFDRISTFPEGNEVNIIERIPNSEWFQVISPIKFPGWMVSHFPCPVDLKDVH